MTVLVLMEDNEPSRQALTLARKFGEPRSLRMDAVQPFAPDALAAAIAVTADDLNVSAVFAAGTDRGNEVMARLAARTGLPFAANCIAATPGDPVQVTRQRWGGSLLEDARLHSPRPLITVAAHTVPADSGAPPVEVDVKAPDEADLIVRVSDHVAPANGGVSLTTAKVIVSGGRGVGSKEGFAIIEELASLLGAAVGCSRAVTSAGWRPHTDQVGQTGTKVAPEVYIACGISGATQHMAGLKGAKRIVAINSDPQAPLMLNADYTVTGDLKEIVPAEIRLTRLGIGIQAEGGAHVGMIVALFTRRAWSLYRLLRSGKPAARFDNIPARARAEATIVIGQSKLLQRLVPGLVHAAIFWGFLVLFPTIVIAMIGAVDARSTLPWLGAQGWYALLVDVFARAGDEHVDAFRRQQHRALEAKLIAQRLVLRAQFFEIVEADEFVSGDVDVHGEEGRMLEDSQLL